MKHAEVAGILAFLTLSTAPGLNALPKFASRTGASCQSCHVNPTGRGMRTEFGRTFGRDEITLPTYKDSTDFDEFPVDITKNFSIGGDFRTVYLYDRVSGNSTFFQMQGNLYFDLRLNKLFRVYLNKGLYSNSFELIGLARILPLNGYVKVGKFLPAYGTRVDDHNAFIRGGPYGGGPIAGLFPAGYPTGLPFGSRAEDTGVEVGFAPGKFTLSAGLFDHQAAVELPVAGTKRKAVALRADTRFTVGGAPVSFGGSAYVVPSSTENTYYGVFSAVTLFQTLTWTGEVDLLDAPHPGSSSTTGLVFWNELNWMVTPGVDLKAGYDFYDPDRDLRNGAFTQLTLGAEFFVLSGVEIRPLYKHILADVPRPSGTTSGDQFVLLTHFFF